MESFSGMVTSILGLLTLLSDVAIIIGIVLLIMTRRGTGGKLLNDIIHFAGKYTLLFILAVTSASVVSTLYYSEIVGFEPCKLCWFQRIFLYPQFVIVLVALMRKARAVASYLIPLSILGSIVSLYHYSLQWGGTPLIPCSADVALSCSKRFFLEFGYITESMMALTAFLLIVVLSIARNRYEKDSAA